MWGSQWNQWSSTAPNAGLQWELKCPLRMYILEHIFNSCGTLPRRTARSHVPAPVNWPFSSLLHYFLLVHVSWNLPSLPRNSCSALRTKWRNKGRSVGEIFLDPFIKHCRHLQAPWEPSSCRIIIHFLLEMMNPAGIGLLVDFQEIAA